MLRRLSLPFFLRFAHFTVYLFLKPCQGKPVFYFFPLFIFWTRINSYWTRVCPVTTLAILCCHIIIVSPKSAGWKPITSVTVRSMIKRSKVKVTFTRPINAVANSAPCTQVEGITIFLKLACYYYYFMTAYVVLFVLGLLHVVRIRWSKVRAVCLQQASGKLILLLILIWL